MRGGLDRSIRKWKEFGDSDRLTGRRLMVSNPQPGRQGIVGGVPQHAGQGAGALLIENVQLVRTIALVLKS